MRNEERWTPTKFVHTKRGYRASRNPVHVGLGSRLSADISAQWYDRVIPKYAHGDLIDLGCGTVPLYATYRPHVSSVTCVDWSGSLHSTNHIDIEHDLTKPLPFDKNAFDTVIISSVIEHLPEPELIWKEMARILRPNGVVILYVPFLYWIHEVPRDFYRYTEFALRRFADRSGFQVEELTPTGGALEVITDIAAKSFAQKRGGKGIARFLQWICGCVTRMGTRKRLAPKTVKLTPIGYGLVLRKPAV